MVRALNMLGQNQMEKAESLTKILWDAMVVVHACVDAVDHSIVEDQETSSVEAPGALSFIAECLLKICPDLAETLNSVSARQEGEAAPAGSPDVPHGPLNLGPALINAVRTAPGTDAADAFFYTRHPFLQFRPACNSNRVTA